jgi:putative oxidoreductase
MVGAAFVLHGLPKMQHPTSWMNSMDTVPPGFLQATAALIEVVGGVLLIGGLFHRVATVLLACQMIAALALVHIPHGDPFVAVGRPSAELACAYLAVSLLLTATGPGEWSFDAILFGHETAPSGSAAPIPLM